MSVRPEVLAVFDRPDYDVLIIGGGINGLATFRDLAMQGVRVLLVERNDFASGASAASSHMIHGGIRYLENGEFRLVRESVRERNGLLRIAPHHVSPLATTIPIQGVFSGILAAPLRFLTHKQGKPKARGAVLIKIGLTIYDLFSRDGGSVPRHRFRGRRASRRELPELAPDFRFTATYYDASLRDPERLALDVALDGEMAGEAGHATALNYVEAVGGSENGVIVRDVLTGTEQTITSRVIVNASGPWTDLTADALGKPSTLMGGTKGSHVVLDNPELLAATGGREIFFEHQDGRIVLVYPLKGRVLVGTTDLEADPGEPAVCTEEEVDYFFDLVAQVFPDVTVDRSQIVYRFSGIRPLPRHDDMVPGFVSRDYRIVDSEGPGAPMLNLVGGKWTTFRALGEHLADRTLALLQRDRRTSTEGVAIGGGRDYPPSDAKDAWIRSELGGVSLERGRVLLERYGSRAREVVNFLADAHDEPILGDRLSSREVAYFVEHEKATRLNDVLLRRTDLTYTGDLTSDVFEHTLAAFADAAGWDAARVETERSRALAELQAAHGVVPRVAAERAGQRRRAAR